MKQKNARAGTSRHLHVAALATVLVALPIGGALAQTGGAEVARPFIWHAELPRSPENVVNIFRRFENGRREQMVQFYQDVLGIQPLPYTERSAMIRFPVGTSELKLFPVESANELRGRPVSEVVGLRLMTLFFPDEAELTARFVRHGYPKPQFHAAAGTSKLAHVQDPDGHWVELVVVPGAPASTYEQVEYGVTVTDLEKSRAFYREFVGLEELPAADHPLLGTKKYSFRHGDQIISLWSFGASLPKDTTTAGIQYVVWDVERIDAIARAHNVPVDRPLSQAGRFPRTVWLLDPDGLTNYFAQFRASPDELRAAD